MLQLPAMVGQLPLDVQLVPVWMLHVPATVGQLALVVQAVVVWTLQKPAGTQSVLTWQEVPVWMLQWPGMGEGQLALEVHDVPVCTVQ